MSTAQLLWQIPQILGPIALIGIGLGLSACAACVLLLYGLSDEAFHYGEWH